MMRFQLFLGGVGQLSYFRGGYGVINPLDDTQQRLLSPVTKVEIGLHYAPQQAKFEQVTKKALLLPPCSYKALHACVIARSTGNGFEVDSGGVTLLTNGISRFDLIF